MMKQCSIQLSINKCLWLIGLTVFFFASYNFSNAFTAERNDVSSIVFDWETIIPLWSWTIVPYWSIDLMYGLAIFLAKSNQSLKILCFRLLTAQIICVCCFLLFPLKFSFDRPAMDGCFGLLFDILMGFDKPFNQAPSLHITLLIILWQFYASYFQTIFRYILHIWCLLIALSVLTTWQHHFFDIPTGVWVGCLCIWLWPNDGISPLKLAFLTKQYRWAIIYFCLTLLTISLAFYTKGWGLWLFWLSGAFLLVAVNYLLIGAKGFQKQSNGHYALVIALLYLPYFLIMWINSRLWTIKHKPSNFIDDNVYLGRIPSTYYLKHVQFTSIVDLCAELPIGQFKGNYTLMPILDMTPLTQAQCQMTAEIIEQYRLQGRLLVCCALGYSRSATAVIAWLLWTHRAKNVDDAIAKVRLYRRNIVISTRQRLILIEWSRNLHAKI